MPLPSPTSESTAGGDSPSFRFPRVVGGESWISMGTLFFLGLWLLLLAAGRSNLLRDPGTFWHVAVGNKMLASREVIHEDTFSFTRFGQPWVADQWLAECGMAIVHRLAGWDGLLLLTATLLAGIYAWIGARLLRGGLHPLPAVLLLTVAIMIGSPQFHVRPLIATIVLLGVTFGWLVDVENGSRRLRQLWWLVPLFILWTNVHGGMLGGLGTVGLCFGGWCLAAGWNACKTGALATRPRSGMVGLVALLLVLAATALVNPYGVPLPREWLDTLAMPLPSFIEEHARLDLSDAMGWGTLALAAGYMVVLIGVYPRRPRITWLVPLVWFLLAVSRVRNAPLFAVTAAIALADMLPYSRVGRWLHGRGLLARVAGSSVPLLGTSSGEGGQPGEHCLCQAVAHRHENDFCRFKPLILSAIVVAAAIVLQVGKVPVPVVGYGWARFDSERWPMELLPTLEQIDSSSREGTHIFNDLNFGGFLIYHTPRLQIFVDDRCPLYGGKFLLDYERARCNDPAQIDGWREKYGFDYALVRTGEAFDRHLSESAEWRLVKRSSAATLHRHK